jgi:LPS-assembly lipoprotein
MMNRGRKQGNMVGKNTLFFIFFIGFCLTATACGFQPLYSHSGAASATTLATVKILKINNRSGQKLRNFLLERMSPGHIQKKKLYSLEVKISETKGNLNIRKDGSATRAILSISAEFILINNSNDGKFKGNVWSKSSYNALDSKFATLSAENDARNRALRTIAEEIRVRVATALKNPKVFSKPN